MSKFVERAVCNDRPHMVQKFSKPTQAPFPRILSQFGEIKNSTLYTNVYMRRKSRAKDI